MFLNDTVKYKLPIQFSFYTGNTPVGGVVGEDGCDFGYNFESNRIHNAKELGISKPVDIYKKLKPFLKYLISKIRHEVQFPYRTVVDVFLSSERQGYRMVHFELNENFTNDGVLILQYFTSIFKKAFRLQVYANCYCPPGLRVREVSFLKTKVIVIVIQRAKLKKFPFYRYKTISKQNNALSVWKMNRLFYS